MGARKLVTAIAQDLYRRSDGQRGLFQFLRFYFVYPDFKYVVLYRICSCGRDIPFFRLSLLPLFKLHKHNLSTKYGMNISSHMKIGRGLRIDHPGGIYLSSDTVVGDNCNISCGVIFGFVPRGMNIGVPERIGDRVYIGPDAKILGRVTIGNDVVIGANAVVTKSLPDGVSVMGIPARVVGEGGSQDYIRYLV